MDRVRIHTDKFREVERMMALHTMMGPRGPWLWVAGLLAAMVLWPGQGSAQTLRERLAARKQSASSSPVSAPTNSRIQGPGDYVFTLEHDGLTRTYRVHVPKGYSARPTPLVMSFHGGGGNMEYQADDKYYGLISKSESSGWIVVFPNGYSRFRGGKLASWNAGNCCAAARDQNIDDVGFIRQMLKDLRGQLNIDPNRIYANGMSNGALFSHRLACEMSDTVKAIASVAGSDGTKSCNPSKPVSILEIHARDDDMVLFNGGAGKDKAYLANFVSVKDTVENWVQRNACSTPPKRVMERPGAFCDAYSPCRGGSEVRLCVTESGGHSWPGGTKIRTGEKGSTAFSATDLMWEFFASH
jgi:polyhydroxybutyrate depolymerase